MLSELVIFFFKQKPLIKGEKIFYLVFIGENVWSKAGVKDPALGQMSNFFRSAFYM